jgi:hypothetical protein
MNRISLGMITNHHFGDEYHLHGDNYLCKLYIFTATFGDTVAGIILLQEAGTNISWRALLARAKAGDGPKIKAVSDQRHGTSQLVQYSKIDDPYI